MPSPPKQFDVWLVAANTVYKGVPYNVVADWVAQGRLTATDNLRAAGSTEPWKLVKDWELLADFLPQAAPVVTTPGGEPVESEAPEPVDDDFRPRVRKADDDDDVDMIPLIDISMVLLVFFIMMRAAGALSPVEVPDMIYAGELRSDPEAITINIEKIVKGPNPEDETVSYSVRVGETAPKPDHADLPNPEAALRALDELLVDKQRPPEVRVACHRDLPSERVFEMLPELKKRKDKNQILAFYAEVTEAPKKE